MYTQMGRHLTLNVLFKVHSVNLPYDFKIMAYLFVEDRFNKI